MGTRKLITAELSESQLKELRAKPFLERNKIIQDKLAMRQRAKIIKIRAQEKDRKNFIF